MITKEQVKKAGKALTQNPSNKEAMDTLSDWRGLHNRPINTIQALVRSKITALGLSAIVAQRLKRTPSIIKKLQRNPKMSLARMQDIAGIRVVVSSIDEVYRLHDAILMAGKHTPKLPPDDYIENPKDDGYRSLHQIFKYHSDTHPNLTGLRVELQIRTNLQHAWATAVETLGLIEKVSFKVGEGSQDYREFFRLSSLLFSYKENYPIDNIKQIAKACKNLETDLSIFYKLQSIKVVLNHVQSKKTAYYLMELDLMAKEINLTPFDKRQLSIAEVFYKLRELELQASNDNTKELVLISAGDLSNIKKAYPNYFLDTEYFVSELKGLFADLVG